MRHFFRGLLFLSWCTSVNAHEAMPLVAVGQIVEHPALDTLRLGLKEGLEKQGYTEGKTLNWVYENAQGNPSTAVQIGHKLVSLEPAVIVTLSTPMTQAVAASTSTTPLVFGAVTDPSAAKLTTCPNVTGLTDFVPPQKQIALIKMFLPHLKSLGLIFNTGEANSRKQVEEIKALCALEGITVHEAPVTKTSDVLMVAKASVGKVDAFLLPTDNTVISGLEAILKVANQYKVPVFGSDVDIVRRGALAAYGVDWHQSGLALGDMVGKLLKGKTIKDVPIQHPTTLHLHVNEGTAQKVGVSIPDAVRKTADKVFPDS